MEFSLFDEAATVARGMVAASLGPISAQARKYGLKVWFGPAQGGKVPPEHYEAQVISARHVAAAKSLAIEVGFHAEHPSAAENARVLEALAADEGRWRKALGAEAVCGPFLGRADQWRRLSETWPDPDLGDTDLAFEIGARLADYIAAIEPLRRGTPPRTRQRRPTRAH